MIDNKNIQDAESKLEILNDDEYAKETIWTGRYDHRFPMEKDCTFYCADADWKYCTAALQYGGQYRGREICGR